MLRVCRFEMHEFVISAQYHSLYNQSLPLTAILYRPYGEFSIVLLWGSNWYNYSRQGTYSEHGPYYPETVTVTNMP